MIGLIVGTALGAVLALVISWAVQRRRGRAPSRHRAGPGRPALPVAVATPSSVERATAPILSFGVEQTR